MSNMCFYLLCSICFRYVSIIGDTGTIWSSNTYYYWCTTLRLISNVF